MSEASLPPTLTPDDLAIVRLLNSEPDDWTKKSFGASFVHLSLAHRIREIDPAMALLRAITAEEEAASGLLRALRAIKYSKSDELRAKDHLQKAAV